MGTEREFDALASEAIRASEQECFDEAMGNNKVPEPDETGDRSLETMGQGLEGQHEADDDETGEGDEPAAEAHEGKPEGEEDDGKEQEGRERDAQGKFKPKGEGQPGKTETPAERGLRADLVAERNGRRAAEDSLKAYREESDRRFAALEARLSQAQQPQPPKPEPEQKPVPDRWTDPEGYDRYQREQLLAQVEQQFVVREQARMQGSFQESYAEHGDAFVQAYRAADAVPGQQGQQLLNYIRNAPHPGKALMQWHRQAQAAAEIGRDPAAFRERERAALRESLMKDPEFRQQILAEMQGEARQNPNDGSPARPAVKLPPSLSSARGAGASRASIGGTSDAELFDDAMR